MIRQLSRGVFGFVRIVVYVACCVGCIVTQLVALVMLLVMVIGPPLFIHEVFPSAFTSVREWWVEQEEVDSSLEFFLGLIGNAAFLALIGVLGLIPYLFTKAAEKIPGSIGAIYSEFRIVICDRWLPEHGRQARLSVLAEIVKNRAKGLTKTMGSSVSLLAALVTLATAVMLGSMLVSEGMKPSAVDVVLEINGETEARRLMDGERIKIDIGNVDGVPCPHSIVSPGCGGINFRE